MSSPSGRKLTARFSDPWIKELHDTSAISQNFTRDALAEFTGNNADYLLVAYAREHQHTVVTHERSQPKARKRVLIPDACLAMGVRTMDTFQMLRKAGARLDLSANSSIP